MIPANQTQKMWRSALNRGTAERSVRRVPASANSLGRVVPAVWTTASLASAASLGSNPARAGCAPIASAGRSVFPGFLNVSRGGRFGAFLTPKLRIHHCIHGDRLERRSGCSATVVHDVRSVAILPPVSGARSRQHFLKQLCRKRSAWLGYGVAPLRRSLWYGRSDD